MNNKVNQRLDFLEKAAAVMAKTDKISPIPNKHIPTLNESLRLESKTLGHIDMGDIDLGYEPQNSPSVQSNISMTESASRLPKDIYNSITSNPIQEFNGNINGLSVLDSYMPKIEQNKQRINEQYNYEEKEMPDVSSMFKNIKNNKKLHEQDNYQTSVNQTINYDIINALIKNAISEALSGLESKLLKESKVTSNDKLIVAIGSTVQFIDKNGNIFQGKLSKTGNIKDLK